MQVGPHQGEFCERSPLGILSYSQGWEALLKAWDMEDALSCLSMGLPRVFLSSSHVTMPGGVGSLNIFFHSTWGTCKPTTPSRTNLQKQQISSNPREKTCHVGLTEIQFVRLRKVLSQGGFKRMAKDLPGSPVSHPWDLPPLCDVPPLYSKI